MLKPLIVWSLLVFLMSGCATQDRQSFGLREAAETIDQRESIALFYANPEGVDFRTRPQEDVRVSSANVLYSGAGGVAGVLVQIAAHSAIIEGAKQRQINAIKKRSRKMLEPLSAHVDAVDVDAFEQTPGDLPLQPVEPRQYPEGKLILFSYPVFYVSRNLDRLALDHQVSVYRLEADGREKVYANVVRAVGPGMEKRKDLLELPIEGEGDLSSIAARYYRRTLELAYADMVQSLPEPAEAEKSFRWHWDNSLEVERGRLVDRREGRRLVRNLRGWLVLLPEDDAEDKLDPGALSSVPWGARSVPKAQTPRPHR